MRHLITLLSVCFLSSGAWAGDYEVNKAYGGDAKAYGGNAKAYGGTGVGVGVGIGAAKSSSGGNSVSTSVDASTKVDAEPAYAPNPAVFNPTAPCMVPLSGGVGALGLVSLGAAGGYVNEKCQELEDAKAMCKLAQQYPENRPLQKRCIAQMIAATGNDKIVPVAATPAPVATQKPTKLTQTASAGGKDKDDLACVFGWGLKHLDC